MGRARDAGNQEPQGTRRRREQGEGTGGAEVQERLQEVMQYSRDGLVPPSGGVTIALWGFPTRFRPLARRICRPLSCPSVPVSPSIFGLISRFRRCEAGGVLVEYALLVSLIAGGTIAAILTFGTTLGAYYTQIGNELALVLGDGQGAPGANGDPPAQPSPPGHGGTPPGQGGAPPGGGPCNNPGQGRPPHC